ncbi:hypothetical protein A8U91_03375 [Halomonas elongata]|uniref:Uncharacterized protein n=1 Tax=Halomonas elongata TaxID=2746 RepID=A0A1B8NWF0_HALEL|nr:hypothetical protein A8U91_03375 [Halomonas elongata]
MTLRPGQGRRRIGQAGRRIQCLGKCVQGEHLVLEIGRVGMIGGSEVAHQMQVAHLRRGRAQARPDRRRPFGSKSQAMHAGIDLDPGGNRLRRSMGEQRLDLPVAVHHRPQLQRFHPRQLIGREDPLQQDDRCRDATFAQGFRLFEAGHGKGRRQPFQRSGAGHQAVAVGIGLKDRQRPAGRRQVPGETVVVAQGIEVDVGTQGSSHELLQWGGIFVRCFPNQRSCISMPRLLPNKDPNSLRHAGHNANITKNTRPSFF